MLNTFCKKEDFHKPLQTEGGDGVEVGAVERDVLLILFIHLFFLYYASTM